MSVMRFVVFKASVGLIASVALLYTPGPAAASPSTEPSVVPGGFSDWYALADMQRKLNAAATVIQKAAADPGSGYSGVIAAPENRRLDVYWKGTVPSDIGRLIAVEGKVVPIRVLPAKFNAEELLAASRSAGADSAVAESAPLPDGSGVHVVWNQGAKAAGRTRASLTTSQVPIFDDTAESAGKVDFSREDDSPYYYGGARTSNCTAGFAVTVGGSPRMLYAGHCGSNGNSVYDGGGQLIGTITGDNDSRDTALINGPGMGRMWDGGNLSNYSKAVQGATFSNVGNWVCTSGSRSGVICSIQVKANNVTWGDQYPMVKAEQVNHTQSAGPGDSGGPVFELPSPDTGKVLAKGIIKGGDTTTTVPCNIGAPNSGCTWRLYYADATQTISWYGAVIATF
ncbi:hypothetical protein [Dactylosporangium sp. NPDC005555]|uniref:hypothetical protein n=1 Tax=Dactylosporangium sp. NPDC005555 TaxID=3154889 RepID=UPI0033B6AFBE